MSYYDTIEIDLTHAREILARGKDAVWPNADRGTIYGGDTYAAYKLLESFVAEIEYQQRALLECQQEKRGQFMLLARIRMMADEATGIDRSKNDPRKSGAIGAVEALVEKYQQLRAAVALNRDPERLAEIQAIARRVRAGDLDGFEPVPPEE